MRLRFNTAGPCIPGRHYMLPALDRLPEVRRLVEDEDYFVVHAPRQTGKTTARNALIAPHLMLMAFLQRVLNGGGRIVREMALGSRRLALCVEYRGRRYVVEVKTSKNFEGEKSYSQFAGYLESLRLAEGWMTVFDTDSGKPWDEKLYLRDVVCDGKTIHLVGL